MGATILLIDFPEIFIHRIPPRMLIMAGFYDFLSSQFMRVLTLGLLNISLPWQIQAQEETAIISWRECSKKSAQQGRSHFDVRSVHGVREHGKMARTPLAAFSNIPTLQSGVRRVEMKMFPQVC